MNWSTILVAIVPALLAAVGAVVGAVVGGSVVHIFTRRRDAENERRKQRLEYLLGAYRALAQAAHRDLHGEHGEQFESAIDDIVMLGSQEQLVTARQVIDALATDHAASIDDLLVLLRRDLRAELGLADDRLDKVPSVRFGESFDRAAAHTGAAAVAASIQSNARNNISKMGMPWTSDQFSKLRTLAERAPGAAVVGAYQLVSTTLAELLARNDINVRDESRADGVELAQIAVSNGLASEQLVALIRGLRVMYDISHQGGSGTGLSLEQANVYLDLTAAALYILGASTS